MGHGGRERGYAIGFGVMKKNRYAIIQFDKSAEMSTKLTSTLTKNIFDSRARAPTRNGLMRRQREIDLCFGREKLTRASAEKN